MFKNVSLKHEAEQHSDYKSVKLCRGPEPVDTFWKLWSKASRKVNDLMKKEQPFVILKIPSLYIMCTERKVPVWDILKRQSFTHFVRLPLSRLKVFNKNEFHFSHNSTYIQSPNVKVLTYILLFLTERGLISAHEIKSPLKSAHFLHSTTEKIMRTKRGSFTHFTEWIFMTFFCFLKWLQYIKKSNLFFLWCSTSFTRTVWLKDAPQDWNEQLHQTPKSSGTQSVNLWVLSCAACWVYTLCQGSQPEPAVLCSTHKWL